MKSKKLFSKFFLMFWLFVLISVKMYGEANEKYQINVGKWTIEFDKTTKQSTFSKEGKIILSGVSANAKVDGSMIYSQDYTDVTFSNVTETDETGQAEKHEIIYTAVGKPTIRQQFYLYPDKDFFLTKIVLQSASAAKISSNYIAPIYTTDKNSFLPSSPNNRMLTIPYDNEGGIRYGSFPLTSDTLSFEVTSIFNGDWQGALIAGSVDHDTWKSGIRLSASDNQFINKLECFNGITHHATRDNNPVEEFVGGEWVEVDKIVPHGAIRDNEVESSRFMVGYFDDWRVSLETFGDVNEVIAPKRAWDKGVPFGWNSWGSMKDGINLESVKSVSDFMKENLQNNSFENDNTLYIDLDSHWDNMNDTQLKAFADHCYANGHVPGVYWSPFRQWFAWDRAIEGSTYRYSDTWIIANGKKKSRMENSLCMDPTHPGTLDRMKFYVDRFKKAGFKYIKLDFLGDGAVEADFFYGKNISTGTQAYNYGMNYFKELCGEDIFLVQSISPVFPANYAHARRISCDVYGSMGDTEYAMNCLSFGWWLDRVYVFNDPDHLVMGGWSEGENRARMTSGAVIGLCMIGDNLSTAGHSIGNPAEQEKVKKFATNPYINEMARKCRTFRPAYGHMNNSVSGAVEVFTSETSENYYVVHFNYGASNISSYLELDALGIDASNVSGGRECWTKMPANINKGKLLCSIPGKDVRVYQLFKKTSSLIEQQTDSDNRLIVAYHKENETLTVSCSETLKKINLVSIQGAAMITQEKNELDISGLPKGVYIITAETIKGKMMSSKFIK